MANRDTKLSIIVDAKNQTSQGFSGVERSLMSFYGTAMNVADTLQSIGTYGTIGFGLVSASLGVAINEARAAEAVQFRLAQILRTATGATDAQIAALHAQADALEEVGVASGESITQVQAQLATFDLQANTIAALTPAVVDYVIAEKGATASTEDFKQMTNGLAQALNGNFDSLTSVGFVLDETTRQLVSNGSEAERTAAIVDVLNSTYEGFNEAARGTAEGGMVALNNEFGQLKETIGEQFLPVLNSLTGSMIPILDRVTAWVEQNPKLTQTIVGVALAGTALMITLGAIGFALPLVSAGLIALTGPAGIVIGIMAGIGFAVMQVVKILDILTNHWEETWLGIKLITADAVNGVIGMVESMINGIIEKINGFIERLNRIIERAADVTGIRARTIGALDSVTLGRIDTQGIIDRAVSSNTANQSVVVTGNTILSEDVAEQIGDMIMSRLKLSNAL